MDISSLRERHDLDTLTVTQLNHAVKNLIENTSLLQRISVRGELSNVNLHTSGHIYFTLKDNESAVKCVMFRSSVQSLRFTPKEGMRVLLYGSVSVYTRGGSYQITVTGMQPDGVGALYLAYTELKNKLQSEGLFDEDHKLPLPPYPMRIGVITSPTGAAVRDIINVTGRRFPLARIYLYPSLVQGDGSEQNLLRALRYFEESRLVDVIIIGRGGGSIEDLWSFNSESLARAIYSMTIPVVSAVGHETDFTICDFVSDLRAPTPSAAAEAVTPDGISTLYYIDELMQRMARGLKHRVDRLGARLEILLSSTVFKERERIFDAQQERLDNALRELCDTLSRAVEKREADLSVVLAKLEALSPLSVLNRGYSLVRGRDGTPVRSVASLKPEDEISVLLSDGTVVATVRELRGK